MLKSNKTFGSMFNASAIKKTFEILVLMTPRSILPIWLSSISHLYANSSCDICLACLTFLRFLPNALITLSFCVKFTQQ